MKWKLNLKENQIINKRKDIVLDLNNPFDLIFLVRKLNDYDVDISLLNDYIKSIEYKKDCFKEK